jgi:hypothetical protein
MRFMGKDEIDEPQDPLAGIKEHLDGFIVVAYLKGTHKKVAIKYASDPACADGLSFLDERITNWLQLGAGTQGLEGVDEKGDAQ